MQHPTDIVAGLRAASLFSQLDDSQVERLAAIVRQRELGAGQTVFMQGQRAAAFYLLVTGRVKVFKTLRDGRTATLRHVGPGETFAESVLFSDAYPSSAEAMEESVVYRLLVDDFRRLVLDEPGIGIVLLGTMARLMVLLNQRVEELLLPVPARLARYLLTLADEQLGPPLPGGPGHASVAGPPPAEHPRVVKLPTSKRELAARLGTVPETLSRTFDRFKRAKVVRMSGDHQLIEILDFAALRRLAQQD